MMNNAITIQPLLEAQTNAHNLHTGELFRYQGIVFMRINGGALNLSTGVTVDYTTIQEWPTTAMPVGTVVTLTVRK